jgi:hypothetical protein
VTFCIDLLQRFRFRGGTAFHWAVGHDRSAEAGLSLANGKRTSFGRFFAIRPAAGEACLPANPNPYNGGKLSLFYGGLQ